MSEAKDWAGELISGQTGTGRILVSQIRKKKGKSSHTWAVNRYSLTKKLLLSWGHECNYEYEDSFYDIMRKIGIVLVAASCCTIARKGAYCCTHDLSMWWYKMCQIGKGESSMTAFPDESCDDDRDLGPSDRASYIHYHWFSRMIEEAKEHPSLTFQASLDLQS